MSRIRVMALMDAYTLTGPAKNFLRLCRLIGSVSENRCEISLVSVSRLGVPVQPANNPFLSAARSIPIRVDVIPEQRPFDRRVVTELRRMIRESAPDIIQSHGFKSHALARLARSGRESWLAYHHGYTAENWKVRLYNQLDRWSLPKADRVVTVCRPFADMLAQRGVARERIRIVPNSIEPDWKPTHNTQALRQELGLADHDSVVLSIGRLSPEKGHRDLVEAVRILTAGNDAPPFQLVLMGDGLERERLTRQVDALGLRDRVRLIGHRSDALPYYELASLFVLPSHTEGSPNVLLEAMVAGVPIAACNVGGVPETVEDEKTALLVQPRDPAALAQAMARILTDPALAGCLRSNALAAVRARYSPERYCHSLLQVYRELSAASTERRGI